MVGSATRSSQDCTSPYITHNVGDVPSRMHALNPVSSLNTFKYSLLLSCKMAISLAASPPSIVRALALELLAQPTSVQASKRKEYSVNGVSSSRRKVPVTVDCTMALDSGAVRNTLYKVIPPFGVRGVVQFIRMEVDDTTMS